MSDDSEQESRAKLALSLLTTQMQTHERYHTQKESMTWLITVAYLGATALLVGREPFWQAWSIPVFSSWLILLFVTACAAIHFLQSQFRDRHRSSAFFLAANNVATRWATAKLPTDAQLEPMELHELDNMLVPAEVEQCFRSLFHAKSSPPQRVALVLVVLWSLAAGAYVVGTYIG